MIKDLLKKLFLLRDDKKKEYNRVLPMGDYISDRWEKARYLGFGEGSSIYDTSYVFGDVQVGANTWIGPFTVLDGSAGLKIGSYCSIGAGVQIYTHDTVEWALSGGEADYQKSETVIGDNCFIGPSAIIMRGVTIGKGCVVGAGSVVMDDLPDGSKYYGNPYYMEKGKKIYFKNVRPAPSHESS